MPSSVLHVTHVGVLVWVCFRHCVSDVVFQTSCFRRRVSDVVFQTLCSVWMLRVHTELWSVSTAATCCWFEIFTEKFFLQLTTLAEILFADCEFTNPRLEQHDGINKSNPHDDNMMTDMIDNILFDWMSESPCSLRVCLQILLYYYIYYYILLY